MKLQRILETLRWLDNYAPEDWQPNKSEPGAPDDSEIGYAIQVSLWAVLGLRHLTDHDIERFEGAEREDLAQALYAVKVR